jgi:hypothetical protein
MITKDNYEIWMMDYLDGVLSDADNRLFQAFLDHNPAIQAELEGLDTFVVKPLHKDIFSEKNLLLKNEADELGMPYADFLAIKEVEGIELTEYEEKWKLDYSNEKDSLFNRYKNTIIERNNNIKYSKKITLKRVVLIPFLTVSVLRNTGIAASIALFLTIGAATFFKQSYSNTQSVVVNDLPSLIQMPKNKEYHQMVSQVLVSPVDTNSSVKATSKEHSKGGLAISSKVKLEADNIIKPLVSKECDNIMTYKEINAYETGLNVMMPFVIAHNLKQVEKKQLALESHVQRESQRLSRSVRALSSGVKVINFLSGSSATVKTYVNEDGEMVAYQIDAENIQVSQKIKPMSVTN